MKVFPRGYALTDEDLVFAFTVGGVPTAVDDISVRVFYLGNPSSVATDRREMLLNSSEVRFDENGVFYWLDATVSAGLPVGDYEIAWIFDLDGVTRMAVDEFTVVGAV